MRKWPERLRGLDKPVAAARQQVRLSRIWKIRWPSFTSSASATSTASAPMQNRGKDELLKLILKLLPSEAPATWPTWRRRTSSWPSSAGATRARARSSTAWPRSRAPSSARLPAPRATASTSASNGTARRFIAIDTAGVRFKGKIKNDVDFYSLARAERSIRRADVVLHFFDSEYSVSQLDKQLAGYILEQYKPAIFVVNKWDLMPAPDDRHVRRLSAQGLSQPRSCADRVHHGQGRQERADGAEPGPEPAQAGLRPRDDRRTQPRAAAGRGQAGPAEPAEPQPQGLLRHPGRHRSRRPSCCSPTARSCSTTPISAICSRHSAIICRSRTSPSSCTCARSARIPWARQRAKVQMAARRASVSGRVHAVRRRRRERSGRMCNRFRHEMDSGSRARDNAMKNPRDRRASFSGFARRSVIHRAQTGLALRHFLGRRATKSLQSPPCMAPTF